VGTELIVQTMFGTAKMLRDTGQHPFEIREMVTS
jgi:pyrroline-5-carboxylate reductase